MGTMACRSGDNSSGDNSAVQSANAGTSVGETAVAAPTVKPATPVPVPTALPPAVASPTSQAEPTSLPNGSPGLSGDEDRFINRVERSVSGRFGVDGDPPTLGEIFRAEDGTVGEAVSVCFDRELRDAVGDTAVDEYTSGGPGAQQVLDPAIDALFACVPTDQIRRAAINRWVVGWNWYRSPQGFPDRKVDEPCVQVLYDTNPGKFRQQWLNEDPQLEASCLWDYTTTRVRDEPAGRYEPTETGDTLAGRRGLTLQWISWEPDQWGSIEFTPLGGDRYEVFGRQEREDGRALVIVEGVMQRINATELHLEGSVIMRLDFQDSELCVRSGTMQFLATQGRQYWRMQDFLHCDGATTDYVDIYFG